MDTNLTAELETEHFSLSGHSVRNFKVAMLEQSKK